MKTILAIERVNTDRWRLRVCRADERGNVRASVAVDASLDRVRCLAGEAIGVWALCDETDAHRRKRK